MAELRDSDFLGSSPGSIPLLAFVARLSSSSFVTPLSSPLHHPYFSSLAIRGPATIPTNLFTVCHATRLAFLYHDVLWKAHGTRVGLFSKKRSPVTSTGKGSGVAISGQVGMLQAILVVLGLVFAGTTASAVMQGQKAPVLEPGSGEVAAVYTIATILMAWLYPIFATLPQAPLNAFFLVVDGFATSIGTIALGLQPLLSSTSAPLVLPSLILPSLTGSFGSYLVPLFSLFSPRLSFSHPSYFENWVPTPDVWTPWVAVAVYGGLVDGRGPIFGSLRAALEVLGFRTEGKGGALMRSDEAQALCSIILALVFLTSEFAPSFGRVFSPFITLRPAPPGPRLAALANGASSGSAKKGKRETKPVVVVPRAPAAVSAPAAISSAPSTPSSKSKTTRPPGSQTATATSTARSTPGPDAGSAGSPGSAGDPGSPGSAGDPGDAGSANGEGRRLRKRKAKAAAA